MSERIFNLREQALSPRDQGPEGHRFAAHSPAHALGAVLTGLGIYELGPGKATWPYHFELVEEEWVIVIDGELTVRTPEGELMLRPGDVACFPPGPAGAHAVRNDSSGVVRFAMPSSGLPEGGATVYPDTGLFSIYGHGYSHRGRLGEQVEYWEGTT